MRLYVARHAQTNYNVAGLSNSDPSIDVHLTELGFKQTESLANELTDVDFEVIYISPLKRTRQTAEIINRSHAKQIIVDSNLIDINMGIEGRPVAEFQSALAASDQPWNVRLNDGETLNEVKTRAQKYLDTLRYSEHQSALIITSLAIIKMINAIVHNIEDEKVLDFEFPQGTFTIFELD